MNVLFNGLEMALGIIIVAYLIFFIVGLSILLFSGIIVGIMKVYSVIRYGRKRKRN